ncbi:DUF1289 domain-containing protein [Rubrivivax sp. RP6-9]|uniref:DUF1289 domain-containing protein n=1 Tax=Rubrivivax sp. RP6-9 TaxID=3415750 RepID=UPI003CC5CD6D
MSQADSSVASPCTSVCRMDEASGLCAGCLRSIDEITVWSLLDDTEKRALLQTLAERRVLWLQQQAQKQKEPRAP